MTINEAWYPFLQVYCIHDLQVQLSKTAVSSLQALML